MKNYILFILYLVVVIAALFIPFYKITVMKGQVEYHWNISALLYRWGLIEGGRPFHVMLLILLHVGLPESVFLFHRKRLKK